MLKFWKKHEQDEKDRTTPRGSGKKLLERANASLNSQWFRSKKFTILKEFEAAPKSHGLVEDKGRERAIASTLGYLEGAVAAFAGEDDQAGLKSTADMFLLAYTKIGDPELLDRYIEVCKEASMSEDEITQRLIQAADETQHIDIAVTLYSRSGLKEKTVDAGKRALELYLTAEELDMKSRSRIFDFVVEAFKSAGEKDLLSEAGDKALKAQIDGHHLSHDKDWILDAQKAYEAADDKDKLAELGNQYVDLYLKERMEVWLDKAIPVYKEGAVDPVAKLSNLADKLEKRGYAGMADTMRGKIK